MITPTAGRILWHFDRDDRDTPREPRAAIVARVWTASMVNVLLIQKDGTTQPVTSVPIFEDEEAAMAAGVPFWCEWMPYQKGQAAKTEALEKQTAGALRPPAASP